MYSPDGNSPRIDIVSFSSNEWRIIQALHDVQEALSALTFFMDIPERLGEIERRRFRCYHDIMAVSYWRPFSKSDGLPKLSWAMAGVKPTGGEKALHDRLGAYRNKLAAHTDLGRMRMKVKAHVRDEREQDYPRWPLIAKDDGFEFLDDQRALEAWFWKLRGAMQEKVFALVQSIPANQSVEIDYLS